MKVVSFVPSWTETLIACGADVVGRTRFCIHPSSQIKSIAVVGGTKDIKGDVLGTLAPDLVVLDREENTKEMSDVITHPKLVTHVRSIDDCARELGAMSEAFLRAGDDMVASRLDALASRWRRVCDADSASKAPRDWAGVLEWLTPPPEKAERLCYLIWREPWMAVTRETFIGSVLEKVGIAKSRNVVPEFRGARYPEISDLSSLAPDTVLLFSSEPFPFAKKKRELESIAFPKAIVDGESFSWFGVRSLEFIESALGIGLE